MQTPVAVISDIHSNFEALTAALDDVKAQEVAQVVCLGDIVGYASGNTSNPKDSAGWIPGGC